MPTTLYIPDIHLRHKLVQKIIDHEQANKVVFGGDHFDEFHDTPGQNHMSAQWVRERQEKHPEDEWIWGNHDIPYGYPFRATMCSGNTALKHAAINAAMTPDHWEKFKFHTWIGPYLVTHAGLHSSHMPGLNPDNVKDYMMIESKRAWRCLKSMDSHWMFRAGHARGGSQAFGGVTWLDFNAEFSAIDGIDQIFGHTDLFGYNRTIPVKRKKPLYGELTTPHSRNYCLDTHSLHYAIWNGEKLDIKFVPDEIKDWRT